MAAPVSEMAEEDCHGHGAGEMAPDEHQQSDEHSKNCPDEACTGCASASAFDGVKSERFVIAASAGVDTIATINESETAITPIASLIAAIHPHRGPPPLVRTSLVTLHVLLLN
ncbi:MAG: hypothetical protein AAFW68_08440 [Pseudomonadota bacterium]